MGRICDGIVLGAVLGIVYRCGTPEHVKSDAARQERGRTTERGSEGGGERERGLGIQMSRAEAGKAGSFLQVNSEHQGVSPAPSLIHPCFSLSVSLSHSPRGSLRVVGDRSRLFERNEGGGG